MSTGLYINNQYYDHQTLMHAEDDSLFTNPFEKDVINFYREWYSDKTQFELSTSGSTGHPKKVTFTKNDLIKSAEISIKALGLNPNDNMLLCLHPKYVAGKMMLVRGFIGGLNIYAITPKKNPLENLHQKIHFTALVPNQLYHIIQSENTLEKLKSIDTIIVGGGNIDSMTLSKLKDISSIKIFHTYGMTETLTHIALKKLNERSEQNYKVLSPFEIETDERGCLVIKNPYQAEKLLTNDIVEVLGKDEFRWIGRYDHVINSGGVKIHPEQIEPIIGEYLIKRKIFNAFFTYGIEDKVLGKKLVLFISGELKYDKHQIMEELKNKLPQYKSPKDVISLSDFVYTQTEKVKRKETIKKYFHR